MAVCSGTTFDMVISIVVVNITYPLMILLGRATAGMIIPGMSMDLDFQSIPYTALSPFVASYLPLIYGSLEADTFPSVAFLIWWLILSIVMIVSALYLYRSRKSECAESNYAFPIPKTLIRFVATTAAGLAGALIFHSTFGSTTSFFVGLFVASIIAHIIAEAVYGRGFKGLKKSFAYYGIFGCLCRFLRNLCYRRIRVRYQNSESGRGQLCGNPPDQYRRQLPVEWLQHYG